MTSVFNIEVKESPQKLKSLLNKQTKASKRDRLRALYLYSTGEIKSRRQMAAMLGRDESTIYRWLKTYKNQGLEGLLTVKTSPGRPKKIQGQAMRELQQQLNTRSGFSSYGEIQSWLAKKHQLQIAYSTVHGTVRYRLKAKLKSPRPSSSDSDLTQQQEFKKNYQL